MAVLGSSNNLSNNGGVAVNYTYNGFTLSNQWDEVILQHPSGIIIDSIHYDNGISFPDISGASMMLIDPYIDNSLGVNWVTASVEFGAGDYGTPGEDNNIIDCSQSVGDLNGDGGFNILDVVILANCILSANCNTIQNGCAGDINSDGGYNVLDIVSLISCILSNTCEN